MIHRVTSVATPVAHLVGPGKLKVVNGRLAFSTGKGTPLRLDPNALRTVLCYGPVGVSDEAMQSLFRHQVEVAWLTQGGQRCRGRLACSDSTSTALRLQQYRVLLDETWKREFACQVVDRKIASQMVAARHYQRHGHPDTENIIEHLQRAQGQCRHARDVDVLRGVEGATSAAWFGFFAKLLLPPWQFATRVRRPPTDPVNALLSLGYTMLLNRTIARCEAAGLEVALGALHEYHPGRPSLACDLIEPMRVPAVDRWVVVLCNEHHIQPADFRPAQPGVLLTEEVFPRVIADWERSWYTMHLDAYLDNAVAALVRWVRRCAAESPMPPQGEKNTGGVGNDAKPSDDKA